MNKLSQVLWFFALGMLACYGLSLSWILLAGTAVCVAVAGMSSVMCGMIDGGVKLRWIDAVVVAALLYLGWRQWESPVWDLAKEDMLLMLVGAVVYLGFRVRPMGGMVVSLLAGFTLWNGMTYILQQMGGDPWVPLDEVSRVAATTENYGLFQRYGPFGCSMAMSGLVLLSVAFWGSSLRLWVRLPLAVLAVGGLVLGLMSGSRSAVIAIAVAAILLCVLAWLYMPNLDRKYRSKLRGGIVVALIAGCVMIGVLGFQTFKERASASDEFVDSNIRTEYWGMAVEQILEAPLFGTGARSFSYQCFQFWDDSLATSNANPEFVHNEYLQLWADYGFKGLFLTLAVLMGHWILAFRGIFVASSIPVSWLRVAGILGVTVACVHSFTDFPLRTPWNFVLAAICLAWCVGGDASGKCFVPAFWARVALYPVLLGSLLAVGGYAVKELWAGEPLLEVRQVREDAVWLPEGASAYANQKAHQRSADFRRALHFGHLVEESAMADGEQLQQAEAAYREALERHPYFAEARTRLAVLLMKTGRYEEAAAEFQRAEKFASARDWWYRFYFNWALNEVTRGDLAQSANRGEVAEKHYRRACELLLLGSSESIPREILLAQCYLRRIGRLLRQEKYAEAETMLAEMNQKVSQYVFMKSPDALLGMLAEQYTAAAWNAWMKDKTKLAKSLYETAQALYVRDRQATKGANAAARNAKLEEIRKVLEVLE